MKGGFFRNTGIRADFFSRRGAAWIAVVSFSFVAWSEEHFLLRVFPEEEKKSV